MSDLRITLGWVAAAVRGSLRSGAADLEIQNVTIDSRALVPGDLFIALRGPRFDGHDFVADVMNQGAAGVIVAREVRSARLEPDKELAGGSGGVIEVDDTLAALQDLAHAVRTAAGTRVVAITGSAGRRRPRKPSQHFCPRDFAW